MIGRLFAAAVVISMGVVAIGCSRGDQRFLPVSAETPGAYMRWRQAASDGIPREEWQEFDASLQEIRLQIMSDRQATGSEAIESALRARINGWNFREVLLMGDQFKFNRLEQEREQTRRVMNANAQRLGRTVPLTGDAEIEHARDRQEKRLLEIDAELAGVKRRMSELGRLPIPRGK